MHEHVDICGPKKTVYPTAVLVDPRTLNKEMLLLLERHGWRSEPIWVLVLSEDGMMLSRERWRDGDSKGPHDC